MPKRGFLKDFPADPPIAAGSANADGWLIPGFAHSGLSTNAVSADTIQYIPWYVLTPSIVTDIGIEVTSASAASTSARLGIYVVGKDYQPGALILDAGEVLTDSTGNKNISGLSTFLQAGFYLACALFEGAPTIREVTGNTNRGFDALRGANGIGGFPFIDRPNASQTYGTLPTTGPNWSESGRSSPGRFAGIDCKFSRVQT